MRIHLVSQNFSRAFVGEIALRWATRGHQVVVLTADQGCEATHPRLRIVGGIAAPYDRTSLVHRLLSWTAFQGAAIHARATQEQIDDKADVVVSIGGSLEPLYPDSNRKGSRPRFITWLYDLLPDTLEAHLGPSPVLDAFKPMLRRFFSRRLAASDDIVTISPRMAELVQGRVASPRVWAIPLWAPAVLDSPQPGGADAAGAGIDGASRKPGSSATVAYHGNLGLAYDFETAISAATLLRKDGISFVFCGEGSRRREIEQRIVRDQLDHVTIAPFVPAENLRFSMSEADVHLLPLRPGWDGVSFPSKLFASFAVGRPVVVTGPADSEAARLVVEGGCGEAVPASPRALASVLRGLMSDPVRRHAMGLAGRKLYESRFSIARALAVWDRVLGVGGSEGALRSTGSSMVSHSDAKS